MGKDNPTDLYTKYLDERTANHHIKNLAYRFQEGRPEEAPQLHMMSQSKAEWICGTNVNECEWITMALRDVHHARELAGRALKTKSKVKRNHYNHHHHHHSQGDEKSKARRWWKEVEDVYNRTRCE